MRYPNDPRIRQTLNQISSNLEAANQRTQASLFTFSEACLQPCLNFLQPCLLSFQSCLEASCQPCFSARDDGRRHRQPRYSRRGREGAVFDFYDDWDQEENEWGNDELDRLLAGNEPQQPGRQRGMSYGYGSRGDRRRSVGGKDILGDDPTVVPQSSIFGFLERLPWKIGGRAARYRPNAATLQDNVGRRGQAAEPLMRDEEGGGRSRQGRNRSWTVGSRSTTNSLSSRGDLFPSDDEDDAREIDDEFAMVLGRRTTGGTSDDRSSKRRQTGSRTSTKTTSSQATGKTKKGRRSKSASSERLDDLAEPAAVDIPSMMDLKREEEAVQRAEETEVEMRRQAAQRLASDRGLSSLQEPNATSEQDSKEAGIVETSEISSPVLENDVVKDLSATTPSSPYGSGQPRAADIPGYNLDQNPKPMEPT
ncbi:MAG: hypothetical protein Q9217_006654 [Psora testacea]